MSYDTFRHFADSWGLLYLCVVFLAVAAFMLRPGANERAQEAANIPLRNDDRSEAP